MADTWPVNDGGVGTQSSTEIGYGQGQVDPRLASAAGIGPSLAGSPNSTQDTTMEMQQTEAASETPPPETFAGLTPGLEFLAPRTAIQSLTGEGVLLNPDSFLQGLQGSLSSILGGALNNLLSGLPPVMQDFLNATGITGALSGMVEQLSAGLSQALGSISQGLSNAVGHIAGELGNALTSIPGVGPVIEELGNAASGIVSSLQEGFNSLTPELQAIASDAVGAVGASVLRSPNLASTISAATSGQILGQMRFAENPADGFNRLASAARGADESFFPQTGNPVFADLAARAITAEREFQRVLQQDGDRFAFALNPQRAETALAEASSNIRRVSGGAIQIG